MKRLIVIKIGGSTLGEHDTTIKDIVELQKRGLPEILVHGGGKIITDSLAKSGVTTRFVRGERVTDRQALDIVTETLSGLVNKQLVSEINRSGGKAVGVSGADGSLVLGKIKDVNLGYVGSVEKVDPTLLNVLLKAGYVPVVSPVSINTIDKLDGGPLLLNINADTVAGEIAIAVEAEKLIFLTDVEGICDGSGKLIPELSPNEAEELIDNKVASGGMIPKIRAGIRALSPVDSVRIIDGREPHALLNEAEGKGGGTTIK